MTDLDQKVYSISNPLELVRHQWETSTKGEAAKGYIVGMIDALRWGMSITSVEYEALYDTYVHNEPDKKE